MSHPLPNPKDPASAALKPPPWWLRFLLGLTLGPPGMAAACALTLASFGFLWWVNHKIFGFDFDLERTLPAVLGSWGAGIVATFGPAEGWWSGLLYGGVLGAALGLALGVLLGPFQGLGTTMAGRRPPRLSWA